MGSRLNFSMKDEPVDPPVVANKELQSEEVEEDIVGDGGVEFVVPVKHQHLSSRPEDEVDIQVRNCSAQPAFPDSDE